MRTHQVISAKGDVSLFVLLLAAVVILTASSPAWPASQHNKHASPDTILFNGKILTVDNKFRIAEAVAIRDGRFIAVGRNRTIQRLAGPKTVKIDLKGKTVLPGLIDSHCHFEAAGESQYRVDLSPAKTLGEALGIMKAWAEKAKPDEWVVGQAWNPFAQIQEKRWPTRWEVDKIVPNNPFWIAEGHLGVANSRALQLAGITKDTPDPEGGKIERDPATGEPSGVLWETAQRLVTKLIPPYTHDQLLNIRRVAMAAYNSAGFTGAVVGLADAKSFELWKELWANKEMTTRVRIMYRDVNPAALSVTTFEESVKKDAPLVNFGDEWLKIAGYKLQLDGGMTIRSAYVREAYPDDAKYFGWPIIEPEKFKQLVAACNRHGWRVGVHAVGDAAVDRVLEAYEFADKEKSIKDKRFSIIHASLMQTDQMDRAKELGVRVDIQNVFMWIKAGVVKQFLGEQRANRACPQRWLIDRMGVQNGGAGSDYPINPYNPFVNMYVMTTRMDPNGVVYGADQAVTREEAIRLYTNGSAASTFEEGVKGSIERGKFADLTVISDDILRCPVETIKDVRALMTMVDGKIVYRDQAFQTTAGRK